MSTETTEKKVYPSQLNSKTISARIPVQDYVEFLQDSLSKGISLNDWLLIKIYNNSQSEVLEYENNNVIVISKQDCIDYSEVENLYGYFKDNFDDNFEFTLSKIDVLELLLGLKRKQVLIDRLLNQKREASIQDVKTQLTVIIKNKFTNIDDQREYRKDIFKLLKELE